jgi:hypothetical protein
MLGVVLATTALAGWARAAPPPEPAALLATLQQPPPTRTEFFERRQSPLLRAPLLFGGELQRPAAGVLVKQTRTPHRERTKIQAEQVTVEREQEKPRRFSLRRAPELRALTASVEAVLGGDLALLQKHFRLRMEGSAQAWVLQLEPRDKRLAKRVEALRFLGSAQELRCMDLVLTGAELSRTWLGPLAASAAAADDEAARDALCHAGG